jgi:hypothetical protein
VFWATAFAAGARGSRTTQVGTDLAVRAAAPGPHQGLGYLADGEGVTPTRRQALGSLKGPLAAFAFESVIVGRTAGGQRSDEVVGLLGPVARQTAIAGFFKSTALALAPSVELNGSLMPLGTLGAATPAMTGRPRLAAGTLTLTWATLAAGFSHCDYPIRPSGFYGTEVPFTRPRSIMRAYTRRFDSHGSRTNCMNTSLRPALPQSTQAGALICPVRGSNCPLRIGNGDNP